MKKSAFTLAEIMIVLTVIGILTGILMPIAFHSAPDEDVMKFKKAHNTFTTAIRELVNSDKYYLDGDLSIRADGTVIDGSHEGDNKYFCNTFADLLNAKEVNCQDFSSGLKPYHYLYNLESTYESQQTSADYICISYERKDFPYEVKLNDGVIFYQIAPDTPFGISYAGYNTNFYGNTDSCTNDGICSLQLFKNPRTFDTAGSPTTYKNFCMDIDGINKGESPFGYSVRYDGKIFFGARAVEWLEKSVQKGE